MADVSQLGGGYAQSQAEPGPTVEALLAAVRPGSPGAQLVVIAGPPGVGKSSVCERLLELVPNSFLVDKDWTSGGFVLEASRAAGEPAGCAYGTERYWRSLRPLEYAGALLVACANLVGRRIVFLGGGWGPELSVPALWVGLREGLAPSRLTVIHFDAPPVEEWSRRMACRGARSDRPRFDDFDDFATAVTRFDVWEGAARLSTEQPLHEVVQSALATLE